MVHTVWIDPHYCWNKIFRAFKFGSLITNTISWISPFCHGIWIVCCRFSNSIRVLNIKGTVPYMCIQVKSGECDYSRTLLCFDRIIDTNSFSWFRFIGSIPRYSRRAFIPLSTSRRESLENLFTTSIAFVKTSSFYILKLWFNSRGAGWRRISKCAW